MTRRIPGCLAAFMVVSMLSGCSLFGNSDDVLAGLWGGNAIELQVTAGRTVIRLPCSTTITFPQPIPISSRRTLAAVGFENVPYITGVTDTVAVTGVITGDSLKLEFTHRTERGAGSPVATIVVSGQHGDFSGVALCPA